MYKKHHISDDWLRKNWNAKVAPSLGWLRNWIIRANTCTTCLPIVDGINNLSPQEGALFLIPALATMQIHIPITDHVEISAGWDALKLTKLKNYKDKLYVTGSVNAGLNIFLGDVVFLNAYYEYNHAHNPILKMMGMDTDPTELNGHSFGFRLGAMLSKNNM